MMGSAKCSRSYGLTHGSIGVQPPRNSPKPTAAKVRRASMAMSLSYQSTDAVEILVLVTRLVATVQNPDVALAVDDHGAGHSGDVIGFADRAVLVVDDRETDRCL